ALRREAVDALIARQGQPPDLTLHDPATTLEAALTQIPPARPTEQTPELHLLVRTPEQLEAALQLKPASITLDYLELYGLKPAVKRVRDAGIIVRVASPRVLKPGEERIVRFLHGLDCEILVRSSGLLYALQAQPHRALIGDFSLNAANALS